MTRARLEYNSTNYTRGTTLWHHLLERRFNLLPAGDKIGSIWYRVDVAIVHERVANCDELSHPSDYLFGQWLLVAWISCGGYFVVQPDILAIWCSKVRLEQPFKFLGGADDEFKAVLAGGYGGGLAHRALAGDENGVARAAPIATHAMRTCSVPTGSVEARSLELSSSSPIGTLKAA